MSGFYERRARTRQQKEPRWLSLRVAMRNLPITATDKEIMFRANHILLGHANIQELRRMVRDPEP